MPLDSASSKSVIQLDGVGHDQVAVLVETERVAARVESELQVGSGSACPPRPCRPCPSVTVKTANRSGSTVDDAARVHVPARVPTSGAVGVGTGSIGMRGHALGELAELRAAIPGAR